MAIDKNGTLEPVKDACAGRTRLIREQGSQPSEGGILIEDGLWLGTNCVLLDGAILRQTCVVAAGSVVRCELKAQGVYTGSPLALKGERQ